MPQTKSKSRRSCDTREFELDRRPRNPERDAALNLLRSCVDAELDCFTEVFRYVRDGRARSHDLLEHILAIEHEHAASLVSALKTHHGEA
jgi:hypothetical protein